MSALVTKNSGWVGVVFVLLVSLVAYGFLGNFSQVLQEWEKADEQQKVVSLIDELEKRLAENSDDLSGWVFLAQSYAALDEQEKALASWERSYALAPNQAEILLNLAESLAKNSGGIYSNRAQALVATAYFMDEFNPEALWQKGLVARQQGDYLEARLVWQKLYFQLDSQSDEARGIKGLLNELDEMMQTN